MFGERYNYSYQCFVTENETKPWKIHLDDLRTVESIFRFLDTHFLSMNVQEYLKMYETNTTSGMVSDIYAFTTWVI